MDDGGGAAGHVEYRICPGVYNVQARQERLSNVVGR